MIKRIALTVGIVVLLGVAWLAYAFFKTPETASGTIQAVPLASATPATAAATALATADTGASSTATPETAAATPATAPATGAILFEIAQNRSEARFIINEVLENAPKEVVGSTSQVAGQISVDPADLATVQVGVIQVNARTLATDSEFRNRAVKNRILRTDQYEFVTFAPKQIIGLPAAGAPGEQYSFQIVGDLTITDVTREATFEVTVSAASATELSGTATTTINYADFNLSIPNAPVVNSVEDTVKLELTFVAVPTT